MTSTKKRILTRTIWILSLVSLFTDIASEMLYPVMPVYLRSIGFSVLLIGILEGMAEAIAGLSKGYFGKLSDTLEKRIPFIRVGYLMSAISKPMMAAFIYPLWIFAARSIDRLGKGLRTGARDALLSDESTPETKGRVFGFHRALDTTGAVLGPVFALIFLYFLPGHYRMLFLIAFIPGFLAIILTILIHEAKKKKETLAPGVTFFSFMLYWKTSPAAYRKLVIGLLFFTLINSSDVFLLLRLKDSGLGDTMVIGIYIFYNLVFAIFSYPLGILADRIGLRKIFIAGLFLFSSVYFGMAYVSNLHGFIILFLIYGIYAAATEGISKAWITNITHKKDTATAIGTYTAFQSICTMLASTLAGLIWFRFGAAVTFLLSAVVTIGVAIYLMTIRNK